MSIGALYLHLISTLVITSWELSWIATHQLAISRLDEITTLRIARFLDRGEIQLGCRI